MEKYQEANNLAPIVLFTYNRLSETIKTVEALQKNFLATQSQLFIFSDGPKNEAGKQKVDKVRNYLKTINGFKEVKIYESPHNKGLASSIIDGVTKIINDSKKVIVLEDDLVTSPNFLDFMNDGLNFYEKNNKVMSISGYTFDLPSLKNLNEDSYVGIRASSLGWGTWLPKWENIDWEVSDYSEYRNNIRKRYKFFKVGSDMPRMLKRQMTGKIDSWAIRWCYHQFKNDLISIFPSCSKINHIGDGEDATHSVGARKFDTPLDDSAQRSFNFNSNPKVNKTILKEFNGKFSIRNRGFNKLKRIVGI